VCEGCGLKCIAVRHRDGGYANPKERTAALYVAVPGVEMIDRHDFCTEECLRKFRDHQTSMKGVQQ
jgi:hypothetical protein